MWSPAGDALLIHTHTEVDKTGKSYYGETGLFFEATKVQDLKTTFCRYDRDASKQRETVYGRTIPCLANSHHHH